MAQVATENQTTTSEDERAERAERAETQNTQEQNTHNQLEVMKQMNITSEAQRLLDTALTQCVQDNEDGWQNATYLDPTEQTKNAPFKLKDAFKCGKKLFDMKWMKTICCFCKKKGHDIQYCPTRPTKEEPKLSSAKSNQWIKDCVQSKPIDLQQCCCCAAAADIPSIN